MSNEVGDLEKYGEKVEKHYFAMIILSGLIGWDFGEELRELNI